MCKTSMTLLLSIILSSLIAKQACACNFASGYSANDTSTVNFGTVVVQRNAPIGSTLAEKTMTDLSSRGDFFTCSDDPSTIMTRWGNSSLTSVSYGGETLYQTGVVGVSLRFITPGAGPTVGRYGTGPLAREIYSSQCSATSGIRWNTRYCGNTFGPLTVQLVKTASVTGSGLTFSGDLIRAAFDSIDYAMIYKLTASTIQTAACSVTSKVINVSLGNVSKTTFTGTGSTTPERSFTIDLDCDTSSPVKLTLDDPTGKGTLSNVLPLTTATGSRSTASGVGVQVLYKNTPVTFGAPFNIDAITAKGTMSIPLQARYYQTMTGVTGGDANSIANFTVTYQ